MYQTTGFLSVWWWAESRVPNPIAPASCWRATNAVAAVAATVFVPNSSCYYYWYCFLLILNSRWWGRGRKVTPSPPRPLRTTTSHTSPHVKSTANQVVRARALFFRPYKRIIIIILPPLLYFFFVFLFIEEGRTHAHTRTLRGHKMHCSLQGPGGTRRPPSPPRGPSLGSWK